MTFDERKVFLSEFGMRIKKYRTESGMTLEELANRIGYTSENARSSVQKIEAGKSDLPASKIRNIAMVLNVPVGVLMGWDDFDEKIDTKKLQKEVDLIELIEQQHGKSTTEAFTMYTQLDIDDQGEIRGEMKQMLKSEKYAAKKELKNA